jgi:hypothetical protein
MKQRWSTRMTQTLRSLFRRGVLFAFAASMAVVVAVSPVATRPAGALALTDFLGVGTSLTNGLSSCAIETVGWVICPTMNSIAKIADYGFTYINQNFLRIDYSIASNTSGTYKAWEIMRNIANALFVVAFMVLVYTQLTGRAAGGYNIKRLLPRLIVAAIAVNISYYICVALIDITNIIGDSILSILQGLASKVGVSVMPLGKSSETLASITSSIMAKAGVAWVLLAPIAAVTVSIAVISAAALVLLIMRKTVIAMLILISPILFVAYLLPNLERFFSQGARLFGQLLLIYPIVALLLGAGQIVSATIDTVGGSGDANYRVSGDGYFSRNGGSGSAITDLTAAAAAVLPLLGVWFISKNMSSIMTAAGSRLSATVRSRRGEDKDARVTGKATVGAANAKNPTGLERLGRRQAFSRNRRHASLSGSSLTGEEDGGAAARAGQANRNNQAAQNTLDAAEKAGESSIEAAEKRFEELQNAQINAAAADGLSVDSAIADAMTAGGGAAGDKKDDENHVTAKDLFNNMNRSHESKDKERKLSAGPPPAGSGGGQASAPAQPAAPVASYRAPQIAQSGNIVSGTSASKQPVKIVAVPVQVDASALLGQNQAANRPPDNIAQPPISGTEEKAKARAQQYLFSADQQLAADRDKADILGRNHVEAPTEAPHTAAVNGTESTKDGKE